MKGTESAALSSEITENVQLREPAKTLKHLARIYLLIVIQVDDHGFGRRVSKIYFTPVKIRFSEQRRAADVFY